jgi:chromosome segregation ATPase
MGLEHIITVLIALAGSAGFWSFITGGGKKKREGQTGCQNTLKDQVDRLAEKLDVYTKDKEELLKEIGKLRSELARAQTTIQHLETMLRTR